MYRLIHALSPLDKPRLIKHFLALSPEDRRLRFAGQLPDSMIEEYVNRIDFNRDRVFGAFDTHFDIIGVVHVGLDGDTAELGLSVLPAHRREGLAARLIERATRSAVTHGSRKLWIHFLSENQAMAALTAKLGMQVTAALGEADAWLDLPQASALEMTIEIGATQVDAVLGALRQWLPRAA